MESMSLLGFVVAALVVLVIPGPGVLYVVARSLSQGRGAGLVSVLGLSVGALVHVAAATLGLSAILLTSATAFGIIQFLGAAYLVYLGLAMILTRQSVAERDVDEDRKRTRLFTDGVIISVFNPKIAIFFLAFLPQFVDPGQGNVPLQILFLGTLYVLLALFTDGAYAVLASRIRDWLGGRVMRGSLPRYASGAVFIGLGVSTAFADRS